MPAARGASSLVLGRWHAKDDGGTGGVVAFGDILAYGFPTCWCDACDTESAEAIDDLERYVAAVTGGFVEYRAEMTRPYPDLPDPSATMLGWWSPEAGGAAHGSGPGPEFRTEWAPWAPAD